VIQNQTHLVFTTPVTLNGGATVKQIHSRIAAVGQHTQEHAHLKLLCVFICSLKENAAVNHLRLGIQLYTLWINFNNSSSLYNKAEVEM